MRKPLKIIITGGVTGGHLFPGIAIAEEFLRYDEKNEIIFVTIGNDFEKRALARKGFELKTIKSAGVKGIGIFGKIKAAAMLLIGVMKSARIISKFKPDIIIGVGGYSSAPLMFAASFFKVKTAIHEQNSIPGLTNRILAKKAENIFISFEESKKFFDEKKVIFTGNPLRKEIIEAAKKDGIEDNDFRAEKKFTVFITGGSQAAKSIDNAVLDSINFLENKKELFLIHQSREKDKEKIRTVYSDNGIENIVEPFFIDMASLYKKADLIIARAGAGTIAEITAMGKAAIYIPFPYAADNHQEFNALSLTEKKAGEMILENGLSGRKLAERINYYFTNKEQLKEMRACARKLGMSNSSRNIIENCYRMLSV